MNSIFTILPSSPLCVNTEGPDDVPMHDDVLYIVPALGNMESAPESVLVLSLRGANLKSGSLRLCA